jgi:hypothetical protein
MLDTASSLDCVEVRALLLLRRQHLVVSACDSSFQASSMPWRPDQGVCKLKDCADRCSCAGATSPSDAPSMTCDAVI